MPYTNEMDAANSEYLSQLKHEGADLLLMSPSEGSQDLARLRLIDHEIILLNNKKAKAEISQ